MVEEKACVTVWNNCLDIIKDNVSPQSYRTWFQPIKAVKLKSDILTIQVPSQFFYEWLEQHYIDLLKKTIKKELGADGKLEYSIVMDNAFNAKPYTTKIPSSGKGNIKNQPVHMPININETSIRNPFIIPGLKKIQVDPQLNPNFSFDTYVEGECNRLARSAGYAVAQKPGGTSFNPLLIYGNGGLGKTHLANAIGIEVKNLHPDKTCLLYTSPSPRD